MTDPRTASMRAGMLAVIATLSLAAIADGATHVRYRGTTSQQRPISFTMTGGEVKNLRYRIDDRCPGGKRLFINASGFPALQVKNSNFGGTFVAKAPEKATAIVKGTVAGKTVSGTLSDRTMNPKTHKFCSGKATFRLTKRAGKAPGKGHGSSRQH